ncbi:MAG: hypothetical protein GY794_26360, partial [bacterium]|nr:hypothetical protein [bacterium]
MKKSTLSAITILMLTVGLLTGYARGETAKAAPAILECIPAGSSYYMTNSISKTIDAAEMFLIDIGVGEMMGIGVSRPGDGRQRDSMLLMMLKQSLQLGEGFDPKGAAAVVILDPKVAGVDLVGELKPEKFDRLCAFVVPCTLKNLFVNVEVTTEGRLTVSQMFGEKAYAAQKGSYVVLAPTKTAINAILDSKKTAAAELSADELALIKNSEVTIHYAVGPFRPLFGKFLDLADKKLKSDFDKATAAGLRLYVTMARGYIEQIDAITAGVKLGQNGVNIDSITVAKSGSTAAKIFKAESTNIGGAKVLDCLPSLPYVAAMGMNGWLDNPTLYGALTDMSMAMMGPDSLYKMDEKDKAQMLEWNKEMAGMVTGMQMVIGGAPKGKGMGSLSYVIKCKDSAKYRAMLPKGIEMSNKMIGSEEATPGVPKMSMTYTKDA